MNKKAKSLIIIGILALFLIISITSYFVLADEQVSTISEKEYNSDKYQKIKTDYVDFELPKRATHYWINEGLDKYEVIISNFSIKNNSNYALRITWYDERYISESLQIHYEFKNNKLKKNDISFNSLSKYDRDCLIQIPEGSKVKQECEKIKDKSKLKFNDVNIELGEIEGYKIKQELNYSCNRELEDCTLSVKYPIYSWGPYKDVNITNISSDFLAIDDVNVSACGTLSTDGENYALNESLVDETSGLCILIEGDNIVFDMNGFNISATTYLKHINSEFAIVLANVNNITVQNGLIDYFWYYAILFDYVSNSTIENIVISDTRERGIYVSNGDGGHIFQNITITNSSYYDTDAGAMAIFDPNSYINDININLSKGYGLAIGEGDIIVNNTIVTGTDRNFVSDEGENLGVYDSSFSLPVKQNVFGGYDVDIMGTTNIIFLNVTYNHSLESVDGFSSLIIKWHLKNIQVNKSASPTTPIGNVNVTIYNALGNVVYSNLTDSNGALSPNLHLIEYINDGTKTYHTPHSINLTNSLYYGNSTYYNLTTIRNTDTYTFFLDIIPITISGGGEGYDIIPAVITEIVEVFIEAKGICGNRICEPDYGETFYNCPQDCGGANFDDLILSCFSDDPIEKEKCIINQSPILFYISIFFILITSIAMVSRTEFAKKRVPKIYDFTKSITKFKRKRQPKSGKNPFRKLQKFIKRK